MNYPLISEYIKAIKSAEDNFQELTNLRPVLGDDGQPVMTSGNFAVVFKMQDIETDKIYALKCFTKEQEGRAETYNQIADALKNVDSPYLVSLHYLDKELFVDTDQTADAEFPVLLMDWVDGKTLDKYLRENLDDKYALEMLAYRFSQLAQWLIPQPFAHGDLKPDNILVREDGTLILVDYDGMYVPDMECQKARELGSPDFRHPQRTENDFDEHIDDFPLISILLSLKAISLNPNFVEKYGASDRLLFSVSDYIDIAEILTEGAGFTGPTVGVVFAALTFTAMGQHVSNVWPIFLGYPLLEAVAFLFNLLIGGHSSWTISTQAYINSVAFATGLCPLVGRYGIRAGLAAGALCASLCTATSALHGGLMLYNGGFTTGIVALILIPVLEHYAVEKRDRMGQYINLRDMITVNESAVRSPKTDKDKAAQDGRNSGKDSAAQGGRNSGKDSAAQNGQNSDKVNTSGSRRERGKDK